MSIAAEFVRFLWKEKKFWLLPAVVFLLVAAALLIAAESSPLAPFIYTLF